MLDYNNVNFELNLIKNNIYIGNESKIPVSQLFLDKSTKDITGEPLLLETPITNNKIFNAEDNKLFKEIKKDLEIINNSFIEDLSLLSLRSFCKDKDNRTYILFGNKRNENIKIISTNDFKEIVNILNTVAPPVEENYLSFSVRVLDNKEIEEVNKNTEIDNTKNQDNIKIAKFIEYLNKHNTNEIYLTKGQVLTVINFAKNLAAGGNPIVLVGKISIDYLKNETFINSLDFLESELKSRNLKQQSMAEGIKLTSTISEVNNMIKEKFPDLPAVALKNVAEKEKEQIKKQIRENIDDFIEKRKRFNEKSKEEKYYDREF